ncbi:gamma carbonic anhydrase family protein [Streptomyces morookaense]|uniref:Gamma carbonic anhydrase family protein n=2 Tax=Streptomyces TaxID=1883 RepID=A0A7Y7B763_STRMO|nr:gamma carbonic anhydrase family protein [Streptomyces morookaense]NVK80224.1 gamma carbonic anhydrase family protein [Streptomyces morookaense]GHF40505.1 gamma carbonic anhydrase family protein [Streptomyces morookaense]
MERREEVRTGSGAPLVREVAGRAPGIPSTAFVAPTAVLAGNVTVGERAGIWYHAVLRADFDAVDVGEEANVQDGAVLHADPGYPVRIGARVTIGHNAVLHGCTVADDVLVGMGAIVLDGSRIGPGCLLAAGTVVPQGRHIPARSVVAGPTATVIRTATPADLDLITAAARSYLGLARLHQPRGRPR